LVININLGYILPRYRNIEAFVRRMPVPHFPAPQPYAGENFGVFPLSRSVMMGSAESEQPKLTSREIIFEEFQPM